MKKYPSCTAEIGQFCSKHGVVHNSCGMLNCRECGKEFRDQGGKIYCSFRCNQKNYYSRNRDKILHKMITFHCEICHKYFQLKASRLTEHHHHRNLKFRFCSECLPEGMRICRQIRIQKSGYRPTVLQRARNGSAQLVFDEMQQKLVVVNHNTKASQDDLEFANKMIKKFSQSLPRIIQTKEILTCSLCLVPAPDGIDYRGRFYCQDCAEYKKGIRLP